MLSKMPNEFLELFGADVRSYRPSAGMLNAVSGGSKTTAMQYCEKNINNEEGKPLALLVTFNRDVRGDGTKLTIDQGLAMRVAERFLMESGDFAKRGLNRNISSLSLSRLLCLL
jgi:hypothetical protein